MSLELTSNFPQFSFGMRNINGHSIYEFGDFVLDVDKLMLYRDETEISLPPKVVKTLSVLVENRGEILSKNELMERVWNDAVVEESNLSQYLYLLRKTVGKKPDGNPYIETLRRRGYRFTANVKVRPPDAGDPTPEPSTRTPLIGREKEIESVIAILRRDDVNLVTISGVGGVGKTTLAKAVADKWDGRHQIYFVELAAINRPELVISAIASALGVKESSGTPRLTRLKADLESRSLLIVLDNFEQVAEAATVLSEVLEHAGSGVKILVTSRIALRICNENVFTLQPLQVPEVDRSRVEDLSSCDSVKLFDERARTVNSRFELTPTNLEDVASICRRLEGLPLAIELAAARMNFMSPVAVLKRLEKQLEILKSGSNGAPKRQRTIRETIAWSYDLLPDREKQIFARLGVFCGGFDLEAAESVCGDIADRSSLEILDSVTSLVEQNLLSARNALNGDPRVQMLEVVREFALEMQAEHGDTDQAGLAHAEYFLRLGEDAEPQLVAARSAAWLDRLETEHDNLRGALAWSKGRSPATGQRLAGAIWRFWWLHGHIREACDQLEDFLDVPCADPAIKAKMLSGATFLHRLAGDADRSRRYAEEGASLSEVTGDLRNGALSYNQLGFLALDTADLAEAERMFELGLKKARDLGDIQILALLNNGLGELSRLKEDYDRAAEYYGRALEYNREAGDRVRQTTCLINLGATALMLGDREGAGSFYRSGLEISSEMEDMNGTLYCLEGLAGSYWAARDPERSSLLFGAAHAGRQENNLLLEPADKVPYDRSVSLVREAVGDEDFVGNFSAGGRMGLKGAVDLALETADPAERQKRETGAPALDGPVGVERLRTRPPAGSHETPTPKEAPSTGFQMEQHGNVIALTKWKESERETARRKLEIVPAQPVKKPVIARFWIPAALLLAVAVLIGYFFWFNSGKADLNEKQGAVEFLRLTDGIEPNDAAVSPDGKYFAYTEIDGARSRMWIQQTGQSNRQEVVPWVNKWMGPKTFSPDSQSIYYIEGDAAVGNTLYRVPAFGGPPVKILSGINGAISFGPGGREFVFNRHLSAEKVSQIVIRETDGTGAERVVFSWNDETNGANVAWSPDGKTIALTSGTVRDLGGNCTFYALGVDDAKLDPLSNEKWESCYRIAWRPDGKGIYAISTKDGDGYSTRRDQLYFISYPGGQSRRVTVEGNRHQVASLSVTDNGDVLVIPFNRVSQIWAMDAGGDVRTAVQITKGSGDGRAGIAPMGDGRVAYIARTGENLSIWTMHPDGSDQKQLTTEPQFMEELRSGGDGRYLYFSVPHGRQNDLYRINADGTEMRQVTHGLKVIDSGVSHDGKWIVYSGATISGFSREMDLWKMAIDGGEPIRLGVPGCDMPHFSPDDKLISCVEDQARVKIVSASDGKVLRSFDLLPRSTVNFGARWAPDGKSLVYIVGEKDVSNLWLHPIDGSAPRRLTDFTAGSIYHFVYSLDGKQLFVARGTQIRDAVLVSSSKRQ